MPYFSPKKIKHGGYGTRICFFLSFFFLQTTCILSYGNKREKKMKYTTNGEISNPNQVIIKLPKKRYL